MNRRSFSTIVLLSLVMFMFQCGPEQKPDEPTILINSARITYISGNVEYKSEEIWEEAQLDMELYPEDVLRTGFLSYCELKINGMAELRIQEDTIIGISSLETSGQSQKAGFDLDLGAVLFKVQALVGDSEFEVRSKAAVCAIRGTEFGVSVALNGDTEFFVQEGKIKTFPNLYELDQAGFISKTADFSKQIKNLAEEKGAAILQGQEISYKLSDTEKSFQALSEKINLLTEQSLKPENEIEEINNFFTTLFKEYLPTEISKKNRKFFENDQKTEATPGETAAPEKYPISISTDPDGAEVFINSEKIGLSPITLEKTVGQYTIRIEKTGYDSHESIVSLNTKGVQLNLPLKIDNLQIITAQEIIDRFDAPNTYYSGNQVVSADSLRDNYQMNYNDSFIMEISKGRLKAINFQGDSGIDFLNGKLKFGTPWSAVRDLLGEPVESRDEENSEVFVFDELDIRVVDQKVQDIMVKRFGPLLSHGSYSPHTWVIDFSLKLDAMVREKGLTLEAESL